MSDLSIESWVQYVTAGNPLPLCGRGAQNVWKYLMFSAKKRKKNMVQIKFSKDTSPI